MLRVRMLGVFSAETDGRAVRFSTRKCAAMLAVLALRPGQSMPRARLATMLWPESGETAARTSLRQCLAALRRDVGDGEGRILRTDGDMILVSPDQIECDVAQLDTALASQDGASVAATLYTGDLLDGLETDAEPFEAWRRMESSRLRDRMTATLHEQLARASSEEDVLAAARALLVLDPAAEEAHQALMRAHLARGALGAATRQYERCRDVLSRELNVAPSPETEALRLQIRVPRKAESTSQPSVAVLPFIDLSEDPGQSWFTRAFAEDLTAELGRFHVLQVISANSVYAVHRHGTSARDTAERLGARYLLSGSVRRARDKARLSIDLTDALESRHLWTQRLEFPAERLQGATDEIAGAIAGTLAKRLEHNLILEARAKPAADLRAWECWLQGLSLLRTGAPEHQEEAEGLFRRALALDPNFARAEAGLSLYHFNEWSCMAWDRWDERERHAYTHAMRAVALDPADPMAHLILGRILLYRRDFAKAEHHLERATILNPNDADMQTQMALAYCALGQPERGREAAALAVRLNPFHDDWYFAYAAMPEFYLGEYAASLSLAGRAPEVAADMNAYRAAAEAHLGRIPEAQASLERFRARFRSHITFGREPRPGEAARWLVHVNPCVRREDLARLLEGVRLAGLDVPDDLLAGSDVPKYALSAS